MNDRLRIPTQTKVSRQKLPTGMTTAHHMLNGLGNRPPLYLNHGPDRVSVAARLAQLNSQPVSGIGCDIAVKLHWRAPVRHNKVKQAIAIKIRQGGPIARPSL